MERLSEKTKTYSINVNPTYKDSLFKKVFSDKKDLLELYNAISGRDCKSADELTIYTLEDVLYISRKNDISFIIEDVLSLYEHQSTFNPNMPIRGLIYLAKNLEAYIEEHNINIHSSRLQKLPLPQYIVFYNGNDDCEDKIELTLEDAFVKVDGLTSCINMKATMLNINYGHNAKILEKCKKLREYSLFVSEIKRCISQGMNLSDALDDVIDRFIEKGILRDILVKQRGEVRSMVLNYTLEKHQWFLREEGREEGRAEGREAGLIEGLEAGKNVINKLNDKLLADNRLDDLKRSIGDKDYQDSLIKEYGLNDE